MTTMVNGDQAGPANVMDRPGYDWSEIEGRAVRRLKGKKIHPVPAAIVRQAQRSYDGVPQFDDETGEPIFLRDGSHYIEHSLRWQFESPERAAQFAVHMRNAGAHTTPVTTVQVKIDPEKDGNTGLVEWKAGVRKGPRASA